MYISIFYFSFYAKAKRLRMLLSMHIMAAKILNSEYTLYFYSYSKDVKITLKC